ncbi:MAG: DUF3696 domain-containing protein [Candidatus Sumerlaeia bacterium]|nr:DUF3696 domain-containing protein [Candidatus Sumerlaeia bacterium]
MITSLEIENFKAIGSPGVRIDIKPITLLFGPNSSGKSTIIQALHYLRHLVLYETSDLDRTDSRSGELELGGFRRLVHNHDLDRAIRIRIEHTNRATFDLGLYGYYIDSRDDEESIISSAENVLEHMLKTISMEVEVRWSHLKEKSYISAYRVIVNGHQIAEIIGDPDKNFIRLKAGGFEKAFSEYCTINDTREFLQDIDHYVAEEIPVGYTQWNALFSNFERRVIPNPLSKEASWLSPPVGQLDYMGKDVEQGVFLVLSALLIGPSLLTWGELKHFLNIGPIREIPPRGLEEITADGELSWSRGMAAWNSLLRSERTFVNEVSDWLSKKERLNVGYGLSIQKVLEITDNTLLNQIMETDDYSVLENIREKLRSTAKKKRLVFTQESTGLELHPSEVGIGLSQVLPVVVAALQRVHKIVAIEQPELHIHPAVQVGLGDLFIYASRDEQPIGEEGIAFDTPTIFLIETHSEHLMLRLLRRIEETTDEALPPDALPLTPDQVSVNFIKTDPETNRLRLYPLRIDERGEFIDEWPNGFFDERGDELFR